MPRHWLYELAPLSSNAGGVTTARTAARNAPRSIVDVRRKLSEQALTEKASGVFIIAATPFTDEGALDLASIDSLTDFYLGCGVHGFTLLGMMGEAHKLTAEESLSVVERVVGRAAGPAGDRGRQPRRPRERAAAGARGHDRGRSGRDGGAAAGAQGRRGRLQLLSRRSSRSSGPTFRSSTRTIRRAPASILRRRCSSAWSTTFSSSSC